MAQDLGLIIAIVAGSATIIASTLAMFLWQRSEANSDRRHFQDLQREDRKDLISLHRETEQSVNEHRKEMAQISKNIEMAVIGIQHEIRDFHMRLWEIEKERK